MKRKWTAEEIAMLKETWAEPDGPASVAVETGHILWGVYHKARKLTVGRVRPCRGMKHKDIYRVQEPLPMMQIKTGKCPGKGNGFCGKLLRREDVKETEGFFVKGAFDLVCEAGHRFAMR